MTPIILPHPSDPSWERAREIVAAFRAAKTSNPVIVAALANGYAEAAWKPVIVGDHGQSFGPFQMKWTYYGQPILDALAIDIRTETSLAKPRPSGFICARDAGELGMFDRAACRQDGR